MEIAVDLLADRSFIVRFVEEVTAKHGLRWILA